MRRRRQRLQVSTFPFLAVLLCAMGSLILVLLAMDRRAKLAVLAKSRELAAARAAEYTGKFQARREEMEARLRARQADWEQKRAELQARADSEEQFLDRELRQVRARLAEAAARLRDEQGTLTQLQGQLAARREGVANDEYALARVKGQVEQKAEQVQAADRARARLAAELIALEKTLVELKEARQRDAHTYSVMPYHGKQGAKRRPLYVECAERNVIFHPDRREMALFAAPNEVRTEVLRRIAAQKERPLPGADLHPYLLLLVRPSGVTTYYVLQAALKDTAVEFGYEFVDQDWVLDFPPEEGGGAQQPWMIAQPTNATSGTSTPARNVARGTPRGDLKAGDTRPLNGNAGFPPGQGPTFPRMGAGTGGVGTGALGSSSDPGTSLVRLPGEGGNDWGSPGTVGSGKAGPFGSASGPWNNGPGGQVGGSSAPGVPGMIPVPPGDGSSIPGGTSGPLVSLNSGPGGAGTGPGGALVGGALVPGGPPGPLGGSSSAPGIPGRALAGPLARGSSVAGGPAGSGSTPGGPDMGFPGSSSAGPPGSDLFPSSGGNSGSGSPTPGVTALTPVPGGNGGDGQAGSGTTASGEATAPSPGGPAAGGSTPGGSSPPSLVNPFGVSGSSAAGAGGINPPTLYPEASSGTRTTASGASTGETAPPPGTRKGTRGGRGGMSDGSTPTQDGGGFNPTQPEVPNEKPPPRILRSAIVSGDREVVIFVECRPDGVILYPSGKRFPIDKLTHSPQYNPFFQAIRQAIAQRESLAQPGNPPRIQVRFLVRPDSLWTFHTAYPALELLPVPKTRQDLKTGDDVNAIVTGY